MSKTTLFRCLAQTTTGRCRSLTSGKLCDHHREAAEIAEQKKRDLANRLEVMNQAILQSDLDSRYRASRRAELEDLELGWQTIKRSTEQPVFFNEEGRRAPLICAG